MEERQREALERFGLDPNQIIQKDGRYWMTAEQLGVALGYREPRKSMNNLLNRNRKEFEPFIAVIKLVTPGGMQEVTIYDTDGQRLAAMLARTPKSEKFRAFIVNMLKALERQEFVHISQVRNWQHAVVSQLEAWHDDLLDMQISKQLENSKTMDLAKFRKMRRYRAMGLTQAETGKLLDVSRDSIRRAEQITNTDLFGGVVNDVHKMFDIPVMPRLSLLEGGAR